MNSLLLRRSQGQMRKRKRLNGYSMGRAAERADGWDENASNVENNSLSMYAACREVYAPSGTMLLVSSSESGPFVFFNLISSFFDFLFFFFFVLLESEDGDAADGSRLRFEGVEGGGLASVRGTLLAGEEVSDAGRRLRFFDSCKQTKVHSPLRRNDPQDRYTE